MTAVRLTTFGIILVLLVLVLLVIRERNALGPAAPTGTAAGERGLIVTDLGDGFVQYEGEAMASSIRITVPGGDPGRSVARAILDRARGVDAEMSEWKPGSPLSAVNRNAGGEPIVVPLTLRSLLRRGIEIGDLTGGAFDITWAALWGLWDFRAETPRVPDPEEIAIRTTRIDYRKVEIDDTAGTVRLGAAGMVLGLGGIAKGYTLDEGARIAREGGVDSFLLQSGGQVLVGGTRSGRPWRIGVRDPRGDAEEMFATLEIHEVSVSTSGDYERFFILDGTRYHHILDPRTGRPSRGLRSATVIAPEGILADALSTALVVMGRVDGLRLVESLAEVEALLVDDAGVLHRSSGIDVGLTVHRNPRP